MAYVAAVVSCLALLSFVATLEGLKPMDTSKEPHLFGFLKSNATNGRLATGKDLQTSATAASTITDYLGPRCSESDSGGSCNKPCFKTIPVSGEPDRIEYRAQCINPPNGFPLNLTRSLSELLVTDMKGNNRFNYVNKTTFANYPHLKSLDISTNEITSIHPNAFSALSELRVLNLNHNPVQVLPSFASLTQLTYLQLEDMGITEISSTTFRYLPRLTNLKLGNNRITELKADTFNETCRLEVLELQYNHINKISPFAFRGLTKLHRLSLSGNQLTYLPDNIRGIHNIKTLLLEQMPSLKTLPKQIYSLQLNVAHLTYPSHCCFFKGHEPKFTDQALRKVEEDYFEILNCSTWTSKDSVPDNDPNDNDLRDLLRYLQEQDPGSRRRRSSGSFGYDNTDFNDLFASDDDSELTNAADSLPPSASEMPRISGDTRDNFDISDITKYLGKEDNDTRQLPTNVQPALRPLRPLQPLRPLRPLRPMLKPRPSKKQSEDKEVLTCPTDKNTLRTNRRTDQIDSTNWKSLRQQYCLIYRLLNRQGSRNSSHNETKLRMGQADPNNPFVCTPQPSPFNPCEDLMSWLWLRIAVWLVFFIGFIANFFVLLVTIFSPRAWDVQRILLLNMAIGDLCVAVYLGILATVDQFTKGDYAQTAIGWQSGSGCKVAGFLSVFGSQFSIAMLLIITLERLYLFVFSYYHHELRRRTIVMAVGCAWLYSIIMAALPLLGVSDYSQVATCVPFDTADSASLGYLTFLLVGNGVFFFIILGVYIYIYCTMSRRENISKTNILLARNIAPLVIISFSCWFPVAFVGLWALYAESSLVNLTGSKVFLVLVYPLNCLANPILYALAMRRFRNHVFDFLYNRLGIFENQYHKHRASIFTLTTGMSSRPGSRAGSRAGSRPGSRSASRRGSNSSQGDFLPRRTIEPVLGQPLAPIVQFKPKNLGGLSAMNTERQNSDSDSAYSSTCDTEQQNHARLVSLLQQIASARRTSRISEEMPARAEAKAYHSPSSSSSFESVTAFFMKLSPSWRRGSNLHGASSSAAPRLTRVPEQTKVQMHPSQRTVSAWESSL